MLVRFFIICLAWLTLACTANARTQFADQPAVQQFIMQMAHKHHFDPRELYAVFSEVKYRPSVMRTVKAPAEQKPWYIYKLYFITEWHIREGVLFWNKYHAALERAERVYGVPAGVIVATIGVETKYGKYTGSYPVIDALSNIAFSDSSRAHYFRNELEEFLLLTREQHLNPLTVMGSYAGAIGQPQFMPSSYRHYAVNFSGSGSIDLSHNEEDVIGSIANYYSKHGWFHNQPVAQKTTAYSTRSEAKLIELQGYFGTEYWLGFHNFEVIKRYNPSDLYAMAVYQLSYYITTLKGRSNRV
jgi:membrane-bound lytic murein transglycosylase B